MQGYVNTSRWKQIPPMKLEEAVHEAAMETYGNCSGIEGDIRDVGDQAEQLSKMLGKLMSIMVARGHLNDYEVLTVLDEGNGSWTYRE